MRHSQQTLRYFYKTDHAGVLDRQDGVIKQASLGTAEQGDVLQLYLAVENSQILVARFQAYGSVALIAGGEYICCFLEGKSFAQALALKAKDILKALGLSDLKIHTGLMLERVIGLTLKE